MSFDLAGSDTEGKNYGSLQEMWDSELSEKDSDGKELWYKKAVEYWKKQPATVDGVLGGFGHTSDDDITESTIFLLPFLLKGSMQRTLAMDCGAGVGRISQHLVIGKLGFEKVDLLDPCQHLLDEARRQLPAEKVNKMYTGSIEGHDFGTSQYDLIILQWVGIYLTDTDFVKFIKSARQSLRPNGVIFIKDNCCTDEFKVDKEDSSVTRTDEHYRHLIKEGGGEVVSDGQQVKFPAGLYKVKMYAVK
eukprot:TRINITY_DN6456_c4_g1_i2.p1 TRINITY_DN6456_c4_g1~~TRINITY_DN6456_c4_g1_i2.p1  ORF type:complete len:262 (+),score=48.99 TRINITY_DN6456_c4_g1_i2:48-788(+)